MVLVSENAMERPFKAAGWIGWRHGRESYLSARGRARTGARPSPAAATSKRSGHGACLRKRDGTAVRGGGLDWVEAWHWIISQRPRTGADRGARPSPAAATSKRSGHGACLRKRDGTAVRSGRLDWVEAWHEIMSQRPMTGPVRGAGVVSTRIPRLSISCPPVILKPVYNHEIIVAIPPCGIGWLRARTGRPLARKNRPRSKPRCLPRLPDSRAVPAMDPEQVRTECIEGRRLICGKVLKISPDGLVVDSGYTDLVRPPLTQSWVIPGTVSASRNPAVLELKEPGAPCIGRAS